MEEKLITNPLDSNYSFRTVHPEALDPSNTGPIILHSGEVNYLNSKGFNVIYMEGRSDLSPKPSSMPYVSLGPYNSEFGEGELQVVVDEENTTSHLNRWHPQTTRTSLLVGMLEADILMDLKPSQIAEGVNVVVSDMAWEDVIAALKEKYTVREYRLAP